MRDPYLRVAHPSVGGVLLTAEGAVLLLIDLQERLMPVIHNHQTVVARAVRLAEAAALLDVPVRATEQNPAGSSAAKPGSAAAENVVLVRTACG